jgi:ketosteroid isomerase-like protein
MSRANVEIAKRALDAYNRRDVAAVLAIMTDDYKTVSTLPDAGADFEGRDGLERYFQEVADTWEEWRIIAEDFRDFGDRVVMLGRVEGRGRGSGAPVVTPVAIIDDFRDGKVCLVRSYFDHDEALRAACLAK